MTVSIVEVQDLDASWSDIAELHQALIDHHLPYFPRLLRDGWEGVLREYLVLDDNRLILLAKDDGRAMGYLNARIRRNAAIFEETFGMIEDAFIRPEYRRRGLMGEMLARTDAWFRTSGIIEVRLQVASLNGESVAFWTHAGFKPFTQVLTKTLTEAA